MVYQYFLRFFTVTNFEVFILYTVKNLVKQDLVDSNIDFFRIIMLR